MSCNCWDIGIFAQCELTLLLIWGSVSSTRGTCSWLRWDYLSCSAEFSAIQLARGSAGALQHLHDPLLSAHVKLCIKHLPVPWILFMSIPASATTVSSSCLKASMSWGVNPTGSITHGALWDCHLLCLGNEHKHLQLPAAATHLGCSGLPKFLPWAVPAQGSKALLFRWLGGLHHPVPAQPCPSVPHLGHPWTPRETNDGLGSADRHSSAAQLHH